GSMGTDVPVAVLSDRPVTFFRYFKQQFAQVTNPPIDPIREDLVMSLVSCVGGEGNLLEESPSQCRLLELPHPILTNGDLAKLLRNDVPDFRSRVVEARFANAGDPEAALRDALERIGAEASRAVDEGASLVVVSDRG